MRCILFVLLLSGSAFAVTDNSDGSVTFSREEAENMVENFQRMEADSEQYERDRALAIRTLKKMQEEIDALEKGKCI